MEAAGCGRSGAATIASHIGPGLKSQPGCKSFFANFFIQIDYYEFVHVMKFVPIRTFFM
jgi:hypothetical protein